MMTGMTRFALGLLTTCALGAYLMPEIAGGCAVVAAVIVLAALVCPRSVEGM